MRPDGNPATLFLQEQHAGFTTGLPVTQRKTEPTDYWKGAFEAINDALTDAGHNPEIARSLLTIACYEQRDPESLDKLRTIFVGNRILSEFLSHYVPDGPFTYIRLNDGLSD